ncbi:unnamed protein product [Phytomonas sp. EM1]|nr:unnamed protein product [Phytomonas sp. EM1]|eukprot:CCW60491.1 unnamed protein product [Phytomonas sp. isolate EM1]
MDRLVVRCIGEEDFVFYESTENSCTDSLGISNARELTLHPAEVLYLVEECEEAGTRGGLSANDALRALHGVATPSGRVVVITTHYQERLDPRLLRAGVVTLTIPMEGLNHEQAVEMIRYHFSKKTLTGRDEARIRTALDRFFEKKCREDNKGEEKEIKATGNRINPSHLEQICAECDSASELVECLESGRLDFYDDIF